MEERSQSPGRVLVGMLTAALVMALLLTQVTLALPAFAAAISVSPSAGAPGSGAVVAGSAFTPSASVEICWSGSNCANLGSAVTDETGTFAIGVSIPAVPAGTYVISACQTEVGCAETVFEVLDPPNDSTTTIPDTTTTTTTSPATTTSAAGTSTTSRPTTTSTTRPPSTTTIPRTTTTPPEPATTTIVTTTTTVPGAESSSTTTEVLIVSTSTTLPLLEASAIPFSLDLEALIAKIFAPDEEAPDPATVEGEATGAASLAPPGPAEEGEEAEASSGPNTAVLPRFPSLGIWVGWTLGIIALTVIVLTMDELRRRRGR
ncbi:MAG TPA: hypothetical protein VIC07_10100 [Acidimicrobiia bacterium]